MRALWLEERRLALRDDLPVPVPPAGEALVRVLLAGICGTDLELVRGYYPYTGVPGHEFVGEVEEGPAELIGRRVVGEINAVCGACPTCLAGRRAHCERRTVLGIVGRDGAFAERLLLPAENLHAVPDTVPDEAAVFVEPLAAALEIQEQISVGEDIRVLVLGDGRLGQLVARTLSLTGCDLEAAGRHRPKLDLLEGVGISTVDPAAVQDRAYDLVVECTGNAEGFDVARRAVRPRGALVLKSTYAGALTVDASSLVVDEITLLGSRCGPFAPALRLLEDGTLDPRTLISARYALGDGVAAFERARAPETLKVLLEPAA